VVRGGGTLLPPPRPFGWSDTLTVARPVDCLLTLPLLDLGRLAANQRKVLSPAVMFHNTPASQQFRPGPLNISMATAPHSGQSQSLAPTPYFFSQARRAPARTYPSWLSCPFCAAGPQQWQHRPPCRLLRPLPMEGAPRKTQRMRDFTAIQGMPHTHTHTPHQDACNKGSVEKQQLTTGFGFLRRSRVTNGGLVPPAIGKCHGGVAVSGQHVRVTFVGLRERSAPKAQRDTNPSNQTWRLIENFERSRQAPGAQH